MDQYDSTPMENEDSLSDDLEFSGTGASRLAQQLRAMGQLHAPASILPIVQARLSLESEQWQIRQIGARTLATLGDKAPKQLIDAVLRDEHIEVRLAFLHEIKMQTKSTSMRRAAMIALRGDKQAIIRSAAAAALSVQGDLTTIQALERALLDSDEYVRSTASHALKLLKQREDMAEEFASNSYSILSQATFIAENALKQWKKAQL